jgi:hypothetical protein
VTSQPPKISPEFRSRLEALGATDQMRAILLLDVPSDRVATRRWSAEEARTNTQPAFAEIDQTLSKFGGKRLSDRANPLGFVVVEAGRDAITALASLDRVKAVMENQSVNAI